MTEIWGAYHLHENPQKFQMENQMVCIILFAIFQKLWASVHTCCRLSIFC